VKYLVLDIETVRDPSVWMPPEQEVWHIHGGAGGTIVPPTKDHFAPPHAWYPIVIGCVRMEVRYTESDLKWIVTDRIGVIKPPARSTLPETEQSILRSFAAFMEKDRPEIVTWNGRRFDLPVLMLRSMRHGIPAPWYYKSRDHRYRFSEAGHCDLADAMTDYGACPHVGLDGAAKLIGLPGKFGDVEGKNVAEAYAQGRFEDIHVYCQLDAVQTAFLFLRWQLLKGEMSRGGYIQSARSLIAACEANAEFAEFVERIDRRVLLLGEGNTDSKEAA
jgi:hypothetical protein